MADNSNKTDENYPSRFDHKSQGMRSQSQTEKKAQEEAVKSTASQAAPASDKTIKIDRSSYKTSAQASPVKTTQPSPAQGVSSSKEAAQSAPKTQQASSAASKPSSKVSGVYADADADKAKKASSESLGISVFINKSDIPAYEIGLGDDFYVSPAMKSGKVSKISGDQLKELEANASKKKKKSSKNYVKKKKTPAQKALKAVMWLAIWIIVFLIAFIGYKIGYNVFYDVAVNPDSTKKIEYTVTADATDESVYEDLSELGVMNCTEFIYKIRAKVFEAEYVEGTYYISDGYNIEKIINILAGYNYSSDDDE